MTQTISVVPSIRSHAPRRIGHFSVGVFAGLCAAVVPRLMVMIGQTPGNAGVTVEAISTTYAYAAIAFAMVIGGVVVILEWDVKRPPRDIFMAALGVPALLTSMLNASRLNGEVLEKAADLKAVTDQLVKEANIPVEDSIRLTSPESLLRFVFPTVFAQELTVAQQATKTGSLGVRYREPVYWVVLASAATKENADRMANQLGKWGRLKVEKVGDAYYVCPEGGVLPVLAGCLEGRGAEASEPRRGESQIGAGWLELTIARQPYNAQQEISVGLSVDLTALRSLRRRCGPVVCRERARRGCRCRAPRRGCVPDALESRGSIGLVRREPWGEEDGDDWL